MCEAAAIVDRNQDEDRMLDSRMRMLIWFVQVYMFFHQVHGPWVSDSEQYTLTLLGRTTIQQSFESYVTINIPQQSCYYRSDGQNCNRLVGASWSYIVLATAASFLVN
jgi:hypothetical protein